MWIHHSWKIPNDHTLPPSDASRQVLRRPCGFPQRGYCAMVVLVSRDFKRYTLVMGSSYIKLILGKLLDMDLAEFHMKFGSCNFGWVPWRIHLFLKSIKCPQPRFTPFVAFNRGQNLSQEKQYTWTSNMPSADRERHSAKKIGFHLWYTGRKCSLCLFWASPVNGCCIRIVLAGGTQSIPKRWFGNGILIDGARER